MDRREWNTGIDQEVWKSMRKADRTERGERK